MLRRAAAGAVAVMGFVGAFGVGAPTATAATSSIVFAGPVIAGGPGAAAVPVVYTCTSPPGQNHLFVGLKQGVNVEEHNSTEDPDNQISVFYSTNWKSDSGVNALTCDGRSHKQTILLKNQPGFVPSAALSTGPALLQLCMFDAAAPDGTFSYTMEQVVAGR